MAIAIPPSGEHLPPGGATPAKGKQVFMDKCAVCHGENLEGVKGPVARADRRPRHPEGGTR